MNNFWIINNYNNPLSNVIDELNYQFLIYNQGKYFFVPGTCLIFQVNKYYEG